jgi:hypothetical protein
VVAWARHATAVAWRKLDLFMLMMFRAAPLPLRSGNAIHAYRRPVIPVAPTIVHSQIDQTRQQICGSFQHSHPTSRTRVDGGIDS